jgi:MoxR-like ATPase
MVKLGIGYPNPEEEVEILERRRRRKEDAIVLNAVVSPPAFGAMRQMVEEVFVHPDVERYMVNLATQTRQHRQVAIGVSPRGSLALLKLTRAWAAIHGRSYVLPDDVKQFAREALCHRIILEPSLWGSKNMEETIIDEVIQSVSVPVVPAEHES